MLNEIPPIVTPDQEPEPELTPESPQYQRDAQKHIPKVFHPQQWDIEEEIQNNEAYREYTRENSEDYN